MFRTDENNNPTAFTTDLAREAGLVWSIDYMEGTPFPSPSTLRTAKLLGDPIRLTITLIDRLGFYTAAGKLRWTYVAIFFQLWNSFTEQQKKYTIGQMYHEEGGETMKSLFPTSPI
jgi:hypothetical protein